MGVSRLTCARPNSLSRRLLISWLDTITRSWTLALERNLPAMTGVPLSPLLRVTGAAVGAILLSNALIALLSRALGISHSWGVLGSYAIYAAAGSYAARVSPHRQVLRAALVGAAVGLVDGFLRWAVSAAAGPGRPAASPSAVGWVSIAWFVMTVAGGIAAVAAALSVHRSRHQASAL